MVVRVVPLAGRHRADWERLYAGYAAFYKVAQTPEMRARVWGWIHDPAHEVEALAAEAPEQNGRAVGLAHFRAFARPSTATIGGFLDDLFDDFCFWPAQHACVHASTNRSGRTAAARPIAAVPPPGRTRAPRRRTMRALTPP